MTLPDEKWSNANFWIQSGTLSGQVGDYDTHYVPIVSGGIHTSASSTVAQAQHTVSVHTSNTIHTDIRNITSFWLRGVETGDIHVTSSEPFACANGHEIDLTHVVIGADPKLTHDVCGCVIFYNRNTRTAIGASARFDPSTRELKLEHVHGDINMLFKATMTDVLRVVEAAEAVHVKSTLNKTLSPLQRAVDIGFGVAVLVAVGGWFISPVLGVLGIVACVGTRLASRSMGAKMPQMQAWIASKVEMSPAIKQVLERAFAGKQVA